jgi:uncharacterized membrane protein (UPF0127 family)
MASFKEIKFYLLLLCGIALSLLGIYLFFTSSIGSSLFDLSKNAYTPQIFQNIFPHSTSKEVTITTSSGTYNLNMLVADTDSERQQGLMNVTSLPQNEGMLFEFTDSPSVRTFWMKDTKIPLDMIFLDQNKTVVYIQHSATPCSVDPCTIYSSEFPAEYVIEVNGGWSNTHNLVPGNSVSF